MCQRNPTNPLIRSSKKPSVQIATHHLQELLTHGTETNEHVMYLYLEMLCEMYNLAFLYTDFIPHLLQEGWQDAKRYFASNRRNRQRSNVKPLKSGEPAIIIPSHMGGSHWIGVVRGEIQGQVFFLYVDDMDNKNNEITIRRALQNTDDEFFPPPTLGGLTVQAIIICHTQMNVDHGLSLPCIF